MNNKRLAEKIASKVLTVYGEQECTRAQLMLKNEIGEKNMGGKNKDCLIKEIEEILNEVKG
jgi:hypothetical protein